MWGGGSWDDKRIVLSSVGVCCGYCRILPHTVGYCRILPLVFYAGPGRAARRRVRTEGMVIALFSCQCPLARGNGPGKDGQIKGFGGLGGESD